MVFWLLAIYGRSNIHHHLLLRGKGRRRQTSEEWPDLHPTNPLLAQKRSLVFATVPVQSNPSQFLLNTQLLVYLK